jgi:hypothetical protein
VSRHTHMCQKNHGLPESIRDKLNHYRLNPGGIMATESHMKPCLFACEISAKGEPYQPGAKPQDNCAQKIKG